MGRRPPSLSHVQAAAGTPKPESSGCGFPAPANFHTEAPPTRQGSSLRQEPINTNAGSVHAWLSCGRSAPAAGAIARRERKELVRDDGLCNKYKDGLDFDEIVGPPVAKLPRRGEGDEEGDERVGSIDEDDGACCRVPSA